MFGSEADHQGARPVVAVKDDFAPVAADRVARDPVHHFAEFRHDIGDLFADPLLQIDTEKIGGRAVRQVDAAIGIEADHSGGDAFQHLRGEFAARLDLPVRLDKFFPVSLNFTDHLIERF